MDISASRFTYCQLLCQQILRQSGNLLAEIEAGGISAERFVDSQEICWQKWGVGVFLLANLLTVS